MLKMRFLNPIVLKTMNKNTLLCFRTFPRLIKIERQAIEKVQKELKHYQSELLNRETTYNKVFNNKPQVGVLNALERKVKRDQMIAQVGSSTKLPPLPDSSDSSRRSTRPPS